MHESPFRVVVFHNLPAPYRLQWFERMLKDPDLDVTIYFTGKSKSNRPHWHEHLETPDNRIVILSGLGIPLKGLDNDRFNINPGLMRFVNKHPDVVLLFGYQDFTNQVVAILCHLKHIPYVLFAEVSHVWSRSLRAKISIPIVKRIVRNATRLVPASTSCARFFESLGGNPRVMSVVPPVPDVEPLRRARESAAGDTKGIKGRVAPNGRYLVLFVGRLIEGKGVREAIEALTIINQSREDISMAIVGSGPLQDYVREKSRTLAPNLRFLGSIDDDDLRELYLSADLHIMPSWYEAFGVVCAEALGYGVPSIVTRTSGCSDLISEGENGYLVDPKNPQQLADTILLALSDPRKLSDMKKSALDTSREFDIDVIMSKVKNVITTAAKD